MPDPSCKPQDWPPPHVPVRTMASSRIQVKAGQGPLHTDRGAQRAPPSAAVPPTHSGVGTRKEPSPTAHHLLLDVQLLFSSAPSETAAPAQLLELGSQLVPALPSAWTAGKRRHALRDAGDHTPEGAAMFYHGTNPQFSSSREGGWLKWHRFRRPSSQDALGKLGRDAQVVGGGIPWGKDSAQLRSDQKQRAPDLEKTFGDSGVRSRELAMEHWSKRPKPAKQGVEGKERVEQ